MQRSSRFKSLWSSCRSTYPSPWFPFYSCFFQTSACIVTAADLDDAAHLCNIVRKNAEDKLKKFYVCNSLVGNKERLRRYSSLLHDCVSKGSLREGKMVHGNLITSKTELDSYLWVSLINFYAKCGELDSARKVLDAMPEKDVVSWTALISGFVAEGYGFDAAVLLRDMLREAIRPNDFTVATGLKACALCLDLGFAKQIHAEAMKLGVLHDFFVGSSLVDAYASCCEMLSASRMFFSMPEKNVVVWNVLLNGYAEMSDGKEIMRLFSRIEKLDIRFNRYTLSTVLKGCANSQNSEGGKLVHALMLRNEFEVDEFVGCALVDMYSKCWLLKEALSVFEKIKHPDVVTWTSIITCLDHHGLSGEVANMFNQMRKMGITPNEFTFVSTIAGSSDLDDKRHGKTLHACVLKHGFESENLVSNALVTMYMRNGCVMNGMRVFEGMLFRDSVSWNALLTGFWDSDQGLKVFRLMLMHGFKPTLDTFICIITSCSASLDICLGKQVHSHVIKSGFNRYDHVQTTLVDLYGKTRCLEDAIVCFDGLMEKDIYSWTTMINGYVLSAQAEKVVNCFIEMLLEGVAPNEFTLSLCLSGCEGIVLESGRFFHSIVIKMGYSDYGFVCSSLIDMYGKFGCIDDAETVLKNTESRDTVIWNAIICVYARYGLGEKALEAFRMMIHEGVLPDEITFHAAFSVHKNFELTEKAKQILAH